MSSIYKQRADSTDEPVALDMDCPWCGQEIPADDFEWSGDVDGGWLAMCFRCEREVMQ